MSYNASGGNDTIAVRNLGGTDLTEVTLNLSPGGSTSDGQLDLITLDGTAGSDDLAVASTSNGIQVQGLSATVNIAAPDQSLDQLTLRALGGADTISFNALALPTVAQVTVDLAGADGAADRLVVNADDSANNITVTDIVAGTQVAGLISRVFVTNAEASHDALRINGRGGSDIITVNQSGTAGAVRNVVADGGSGADTIAVSGTAVDGAVTVAPSSDNDSVVVSPSPTGRARVRFDESLHLGSLTVNSGGLTMLTSDGSNVLSTNSIAINGTGKLDLTDNSMIIDYSGSSPIAGVRQRLSSGFNGGAWNGLGIISSAAAQQPGTGIGYAEASDLFNVFPGTFAGQSIDSTSILLTHTFYGDADLNRTVDLLDFNRLSANFGAGGRDWRHGDSDYNQSVNLNDFNALAANFGRAAAAQFGARSDAARHDSSKPMANDVLEL
jgi:hypothetical protein